MGPGNLLIRDHLQQTIGPSPKQGNRHRRVIHMVAENGHLNQMCGLYITGMGVGGGHAHMENVVCIPDGCCIRI